MLTGLEIATRINAGERMNASWGAEEVEPDFHRLLVDSLVATGWKHASSHSVCSKASREHHLEKDGRNVEVVSANFLGRFTQVQS